MFKPLNKYVLVEPIYQEPTEQKDPLAGFRPPRTEPEPAKYTVCKVLACSPDVFISFKNDGWGYSTNSTLNISHQAQIVQEGMLVVVETHLMDVIALAEDELTVVPASAVIGYFKRDEKDED